MLHVMLAVVALPGLENSGSLELESSYGLTQLSGAAVCGCLVGPLCLHLVSYAIIWPELLSMAADVQEREKQERGSKSLGLEVPEYHFHYLPHSTGKSKP